MSSQARRRQGTGLSPVFAGGTVAALMGVNALIGRRTAPDPTHPAIRGWYKRLDKPNFTPPDPVFGVVWPLLGTAFAVGGYRVLRAAPSPRRNASITLWMLTTGTIGGWSELFFRGRALGPSAITSAAMLTAATAYAATTRKVDRVAHATALPMAAWLGFATLLAARVWQLNSASSARYGVATVK